MVENSPHVKFDDIGKSFFYKIILISMIILLPGGQEGAKRALEEAVILPVLRPEVSFPS